MAAEIQVSAHVAVPDATRADTAYLTALERITLQMTAKLHLDDVLATITHGLVEEFHAAFARLWLLGPGDLCTACYQAAACADRERCLHLQASAGLYTNLNGEYRRVPLGVAKIGRIAVEGGPTYTNDTLADDRFPNKPWLREHGLVSFAGYPLLFQEERLGVLALSRPSSGAVQPSRRSSAWSSRWPPPTPPCSFWARPGPARSWWPGRSITSARAGSGRWSKSTAPPCRPP